MTNILLNEFFVKLKAKINHQCSVRVFKGGFPKKNMENSDKVRLSNLICNY